ncbi:hypothetical protein [Nocardiopsis composta]|uniref:Plasmid stabilization system protein ParE n=1 Tax=Nocardiopsis composta TaxID=157465 RepID=A0A7W8QJ58_9ACTN|nr:hypothetical protein [Nocardiopsis composta]MBB5431371.1 plasmid stabilization system protein ParE [Nocardiopsis composta]
MSTDDLRDRIAEAVERWVRSIPVPPPWEPSSIRWQAGEVADAVMAVVGPEEAEARLAELEAENEQLREALSHARRFTWELEPSGDWLNLEHRGADIWRVTRDGDEVAVVTGQEAALARARQIAGEAP